MDFLLNGFLEAFRLLFSGDEETYSAIRATLYTSSVSIFFAILVGFPLGFTLGFYDFKGRRILRLLSDTALAMPTVAIGLILYAFITRNGPFRVINAYKISPIATVGIASAVSLSSLKILRPLKS